jgi:hypothetical protein
MIGDYDDVSRTYAVMLLAEECEVEQSQLRDGDMVTVSIIERDPDEGVWCQVTDLMLESVCESLYDLRAEWEWKRNTTLKNNRVMEDLDRQIAELEAIIGLEHPTTESE